MKQKIPTSQPRVSIVTPVFNEEEHLGECIESVLAQSYQNWDYTIVNNCSTDKSLEIARHYAARDPRIRIHNNTEFLNMAANVNLAVRQISPESKYCKVVFADDWIFPECLEKMVAVAEEYPTAGIVSSYYLLHDRVDATGLPYQKKLISGREACRLFLLQKCFLFGSQNSVLYRADLVRGRDPLFIETDMCADFEACFALLRVSDLGFVHQVLSFSRLRAGSTGAIGYDTGANFSSLLGILFSYGRECLTEDEFEDCLDVQLSQYYSFLGRRAWVERDRHFWSYHRSAFDHAGIRLSRARLAWAAVRELVVSMADPKAMAERVRRSFKFRETRSWQTRRTIITPEHREQRPVSRVQEPADQCAPTFERKARGRV